LTAETITTGFVSLVGATSDMYIESTATEVTAYEAIASTYTTDVKA